jgi:hypothetical protein
LEYCYQYYIHNVFDTISSHHDWIPTKSSTVFTVRKQKANIFVLFWGEERFIACRFIAWQSQLKKLDLKFLVWIWKRSSFHWQASFTERTEHFISVLNRATMNLKEWADLPKQWSFLNIPASKKRPQTMTWISFTANVSCRLSLQRKSIS